MPEWATHPVGRKYRVSGLVCAREGVPFAGWKSLSELATGSVAEGNCVVARRGGEQPEANCRSVG
jgi:hypothetical protein